MRVVQPAQTQLGELPIADIKLDIKSRDDIPQILRGLQYLYLNVELRQAVFALLDEQIQPEINKDDGRPGMSLWCIFVMGVLRLDLDWDYDRLQEQVNNHKTIRQMLGHSNIFELHYYPLQTLKDNVRLLTPELLDEINQVVVNAGHGLSKKKGDEVLRGRCDSFVVKTDVHYPTDINLLFDAMRKVITLTARLSEAHDLSSWRQHAYTIRQVKQTMRTAQMKKRGGGRSESQQARRKREMMASHQAYIDIAQRYLNKATGTLDTLQQRGKLGAVGYLTKLEVEQYIAHAERQIEQIKRRVIEGETIAHEDKVFSLFEPHTEWVVKGKAGVPMELGLRVCVLEDQHQFLLHHEVMEKQTDDKLAVPMVTEAKGRFPGLQSCSFDKGFHSPENQTALKEILEVVALPHKGRRSQKVEQWEKSAAYVGARKKHSAVESAINGLGVHGLDRCPDHGIEGFKRYVALSIVARNLHRIGAILTEQERKRLERKQRRKLKQAA